MQQTVTLIVVCGSSGRKLFASAQKLLTASGFRFDPEPLRQKSHLAFYMTYLDVWSMGNTFERFLYPKKEVRKYESGVSSLWAIRREKLSLRNTARNEEERRLKECLSQARSAYRQATDESYLFMYRSVICCSDGFNPEPERFRPSQLV